MRTGERPASLASIRRNRERNAQRILCAVLEELAEPKHAAGVRPAAIVHRIIQALGCRCQAVRAQLLQLSRSGEIVGFFQEKTLLYRHRQYAAPPGSRRPAGCLLPESITSSEAMP